MSFNVHLKMHDFLSYYD
eukprot:UN10254